MAESAFPLVVTATIFFAGVILGFLLGAVSMFLYSRSPEKLSQGTFTNALALFIALIWGFSVVQSATSSYETPFYVHAIVGIVVGSLFGINTEMASGMLKTKHE